MWVAKRKGVNRGDIVMVITKWETNRGTEINLDDYWSAERWASKTRVRLGRALFELPYASMRDRWVERAYAVLKYRNMVLCQNEARRDENFN